MAEDLDKLGNEVLAQRRRKEVPDETKVLLEKLYKTLKSYDAGEVPSGEVCLRILRGDFDYNLEVIQNYVERRLEHPNRRTKKVPARSSSGAAEEDDD